MRSGLPVCINQLEGDFLKRLDKILSDAGAASRRELKQIIRSGRVTVDGAVCTVPDQKFDETAVSVALDGSPVDTGTFCYYMIDKPDGVVSATEDRLERTVLDLLPAELVRRGLFPVGRLDKDTTGLLLLTNDGDFAHRIISPASHVEKRYAASVDGIPDASDVAAFAEGVTLRDGTVCLPARLEITGSALCYVTVREGKYHQVKRMLASRGKPVKTLRRLTIGALSLDESLGPGGFRALTTAEVLQALSESDL